MQMINTRYTIFETLRKRIRKLTKHADYSPKEFKIILLAVILNDLKEWSEYIPKIGDTDIIVDLLEKILLKNCFIVKRISVDNSNYVNVNTPQNNKTWSIVNNIINYIDKEDPVCEQWTPDPTCETKLIYFITQSGETEKQYLERVYGEYGEKLKTICEKMNVYIDRETGIGWYLADGSQEQGCGWKRLGSKADQGMTQEEVEALLSEYKIHQEWKTISEKPVIELSLRKDSAEIDNTIDLLTKSEVEAMI